METRRKLLGLKSNLQQNWTAYAVANHVAGNAETTVQAIDAFVKTLKVGSIAPRRRRRVAVLQAFGGRRAWGNTTRLKVLTMLMC